MTNMLPILRHYGMTDDVDTYGRGNWKKIHAICHEDQTPSAQTDGEGYRCYACDVFYPTPIGLVMEREACSFDEAQRIVIGLTGDSDTGVRTADRRERSFLPARAGNQQGDRSFLPSRSRT